MSGRETWDYVDSGGATVLNEDVTIQKNVVAGDAAADRKQDPDQRVSEQPKTDGWNTEIPLGKEFNYSFSLHGKMLKEIESRGIMHWSALTNYDPPAYVVGSNGDLYQALAPSGPDDPAGPKDPVTTLPLYGFWRNWTELVVASYNPPEVIFQHRENYGVAGGNAFSSTPPYTKRPITYVDHNSISNFVVNLNTDPTNPSTFEPPVGSYLIDSIQYFSECDACRFWLYNETDNVPVTDVLSTSGSVANLGTGNELNGTARIYQRYTFTAAKRYSWRCRAAGNFNIGMGNPYSSPHPSSGIKEIYAITSFKKVDL